MEQTTNRTPIERRVASTALAATRILAGVIAALVLVQGALAGSHLSGDGGALGLHHVLGTNVLTVLALVAVVTATAAIRVRAWALPATLVGFLGMGMQIGMGFADRLRIHLPLGIALFGLYLGLAITLTDPTKETT